MTTVCLYGKGGIVQADGAGIGVKHLRGMGLGQVVHCRGAGGGHEVDQGQGEEHK